MGNRAKFKAYYKADLPITIDNEGFDVHITVKEDNQGNFFGDAQIKGKLQHATSATNPRDTELSDLDITPSDENINSKLYSQTEGDILGSYDMAKREVELFKGHNPSTITHELGHHFIISHLNFMESIGANDKNKPVFEFLSGLANREINSVRDMERPDHENLVEAFIDYMNIGQAPNIVTGNIFQRAKMVLKFVRSGVEMVGFFIKKRVLTKS